MHTTDIISVFTWWIYLFVIGIGTIPLTTLVFRSFFDRGYPFSKMLGIAFISYATLLLGIMHLIPFTRIGAIIIAALTLLTINGLLVYFHSFTAWRTHVLSIGKTAWQWFLLEEVLFLGGLLFWSYIHSFVPDI